MIDDLSIGSEIDRPRDHRSPWMEGIRWSSDGLSSQKCGARLDQ